MPERGAIYKAAFATSNGFWPILARYQARGLELAITKARKAGWKGPGSESQRNWGDWQKQGVVRRAGPPPRFAKGSVMCNILLDYEAEGLTLRTMQRDRQVIERHSGERDESSHELTGHRRVSESGTTRMKATRGSSNYK
jgi:hypothetical protein